MSESVVLVIKQGDTECTVTYDTYRDFAEAMNKSGTAWKRFPSVKAALKGVANGK